MSENRSIQTTENRKMELMCCLIYSIHHICMLFFGMKLNWPIWIRILMSIAFVSSWIVYFRRRHTCNFRSGFEYAMVLFNVFSFTVQFHEISYSLVPFAGLTVLMSLMGYANIMYISYFWFSFILFFHIFVIETIDIMAPDFSLKYGIPVVNVLYIMVLVHRWITTRTENNEKINGVIEDLKEAEKSRDNFIANVSHEIRTPINTINGMSEIALLEENIDNIKQNVMDIRHAGRNLMTVVSDILDFSELQSGIVELVEEDYNLTSTIHDIINMSKTLLDDKKLDFVVDCDATLPTMLRGDEKKIRRVVMNIVDNSIKFTNDGGIALKIGYRKESYGINLIFTIIDTGIGMDRNGVDKLFSTYNQIDAERNRKTGGIGLGLAISFAIVKAMGGVITVNSELDKGTRMTIVIPQTVIKENKMITIEGSSNIRTIMYFDTEKFLYHDLRDAFNDSIKSFSEKMNIDNHVCKNINELIRRNKRDKYDFIFTSLDDYKNNQEYFDKLSTTDNLVVILDRTEEEMVTNSKIIKIYKPFYSLAISSILRGVKDPKKIESSLHKQPFKADGVKILVVDDNKMNFSVVRGMLKKYNIETVYAMSGFEALDKIESMDYDFVFMDHMMPEMDGIEAFHRIRDKNGNYFKNVPIIALTANAVAGAREMFLKEGFNDFLEKPIETSVLERLLIRTLPENKLVYISQDHSSEKMSGSKTENAVSEDKFGGLYIAPDTNSDSGNYRGYTYMPETDNTEANTNYIPGNNIENTSNYIPGNNIENTSNYIPGNNIENTSNYIPGTDSLIIPDDNTGDNMDNTINNVSTTDEIDYNVLPDESEFTLGDLDVETGMMYCGGLEFYIEILKEYCEKGAENWEPVEKLFADENWKDYTISVHAIKSSMLSIGAQPLSEMAKALEMAGKSDDIEYIKANHAPMIEELKRVIGEICACPYVNQNGANSSSESNSDEIKDEEFDKILLELEDACFDLDGDKMMTVLEKLFVFSYKGSELKEKLKPVVHKIEMSDYMAAFEAVSKIRKV